MTEAGCQAIVGGHGKARHSIYCPLYGEGIGARDNRFYLYLLIYGLDPSAAVDIIVGYVAGATLD